MLFTVAFVSTNEILLWTRMSPIDALLRCKLIDTPLWDIYQDCFKAKIKGYNP